MATPVSPTRDAEIGSKRKEASQRHGGMMDWMILTDVLALSGCHPSVISLNGGLGGKSSNGFQVGVSGSWIDDNDTWEVFN